MTKQGKIWGKTQEIFNNGIISVNYLKIKEGGYCSEHRHKIKSNLFFVINGALEIEIWRNGIIDRTVLLENEMTNIESNVWHKFKALVDTDCIEIYGASLSNEDIERRTVGGIA